MKLIEGVLGLCRYIEGAPKRLEAIGQPVYPPGKVMYCRRLKENATDTSYDTVWIPAEVTPISPLNCQLQICSSFLQSPS